MSVQVSTGTEVLVSTATPATYDFPGFNVLIYTSIGELLDVGDLGNVLGFAEHSPLKTGITEPLPAFLARSETTITLGQDGSDAGQAILQQYATTNIRQKLAFKLLHSDGSARFFTGYLGSLMESVPGGNSVVGATASLRIAGDVLHLSAELAPTAALFAGQAGFFTSLDPKYGLAFTTAAGNVLAVNPGDPLGRIESIAGGLTLKQPSSSLRPSLGRAPKSGVRNRTRNMMVGTVNGAPGSPPTDWTVFNVSGITRTITAMVDTDGLPFLRVTWVGTATAATTLGVLSTLTTAGVAAAAGQTWSASCKIRLSPGASLANTTSQQSLLLERDAGGVLLQSSPFLLGGLTESWTDANITRTLTNASTAMVTHTLAQCAVANGATINLGFDVKLNQLERASAPSALQHVYAPYNITEPGVEDAWYIYGNGAQIMTYGVSSFGTAGLFAAAGQKWTSIVKFMTFMPSGTMLAAAGATTGAQKFSQNIGVVTPLVPHSIIRGSATSAPWGAAAAIGSPQSQAIRWDGAASAGWRNGLPVAAPAVGTAANESQNITVLGRTESAPASFFTGCVMPFLIDTDLSNEEIQRIAA